MDIASAQILSESAQCFSDNPVMLGYNSKLFVTDEQLGYKFPGDVVLGQGSFLSIDEVIRSVHRNTGYPVLLNIGDSSTSGWNSECISRSSQDPRQALFTYRTYSDLLRAITPNVINAGVPGYSSLQSLSYMNNLLLRLRRADISVDLVTLYIGNNDCTYNRIEDKVRLHLKNPSVGGIGQRTSIQDFEHNLREALWSITQYGAQPIVILPVQRYGWEPGVRSLVYREESQQAIASPSFDTIRSLLQSASEHYAKKNFSLALEHDLTLPRIKTAYLRVLRQVARQQGVAVVDVQSQINLENEREMFVDYCHPSEKLNVKIAEDIHSIRMKFLKRTGPAPRRFSFKKALSELFSDEPPPDVYTMF